MDNPHSMNSSNQNNNAPSRIVYLGSIPYDQTEQQILDLCSNVGPVINLRMMFDPITGKSKGYAFIEFKDLESSASAVRNLNGYPLGNRFLKCGYSNNNDISSSSNTTGTNAESENNESESSMRFPNLPQGVDVNINMTTPAMMISSELGRLDKPSQLSLLRTLQSWSREEPQLAVQLLTEYPQLTYVIAELLLTNGICQVDDLTQLAASSTDSSEINKNNDNSASTASDSLLSSDPEQLQRQKDLLRQVLQLTDNDINVLPDNEKAIMWDLKQKVMKGEFGII